MVCYGNTIPAGYSATSLGTDCNDIDATVHQNVMWYLDADNDGHYVNSQMSCNSPGLGWNTTATENGDCDDANSLVWQVAALYVDNDGDGYDNDKRTVCYGATIPAGYSTTTNGSDCDDMMQRFTKAKLGIQMLIMMDTT